MRKEKREKKKEKNEIKKRYVKPRTWAGPLIQ